MLEKGNHLYINLTKENIEKTPSHHSGMRIITGTGWLGYEMKGYRLA